MLAWIGLALLSACWLPGLGYYHLPEPATWAVMAAAGTLFLSGSAVRLPRWPESAVALAMCVPAALLVCVPLVLATPWPYRAGPLLVVLGLALGLLPQPHWRDFRERLALGLPPSDLLTDRAAAAVLRWAVLRLPVALLLGGCVLLAQSLAMLSYAAVTVRSHELPGALAQLTSKAAGVLGMNAAVYDSTIAAFSMRKVHLLGATWELLLDPPTWCFLAGALVVLWWQSWAALPPGRRRLPWLRGALVLLALVALWLPLRAALLTALYLHDVLRTEYDAPLDAMRLFWNTWVLLALLAVPVLLAWRFARVKALARPTAPPASPAAPQWQRPAAVLLIFAAVALLSAGVVWDPVGERQAGRVAFEEYHPEGDRGWERTDVPFDIKSYGKHPFHIPANYNYTFYCIAEYCGHYYDVKRLGAAVHDKRKDKSDDISLEDFDVLVLKTPTRPFHRYELDSMREFVRQGGGLLLIGEHTDVFNTSTHLNAVAEMFGFRFRSDCLFGVDKVFDEYYEPPAVPHPILQYMPAMDFAISCSIDPGGSPGRAVIQGKGLKSLAADYHVTNFYPRPEDSAEMRYGSFVQLWATRYGRGRVVGFADSTDFSNFCAFEPGKSELMLGVLEWLNHRDSIGDPRPWLLCGGLLVLAAGIWLARGWDEAWLVLTAAGLLSWGVTAVGVRVANRLSMPAPQVVEPMVQVVLDRTVCSTPLPKNGFIDAQENGFGIFEQWILRLGYFTTRRNEPEEFGGKLLVFPHPDQPPSARFLAKLKQYVTSGGKVLVIDSPENQESTAAELLEPFGLAMGPPIKQTDTLKTSLGWPSIPIAAARTVQGGRPFAFLGKRPVGATTPYGKGSVTVIGFGSRFTDPNMGVTTDVVPDATLRAVYQVQFSLLRAIVEGKL